jgi:excisionase family DNA binding protein
MPVLDEILTVAEVARELRCSKAHVHHAINGKLAGVTTLPAIRMGRRKLVRRSALENWKRANERGALDAIMPLPEIDAVRPVRGESHAS